MVQNTLVSMDDSGPAWNAFEYALSAYPKATLTALHVVDPGEQHTYGGDMGVAFSGVEVIGRRQHEQASELLAKATKLAENQDREIQTKIDEGHPATVIVTYAEEQGVDQIVIGSHRRMGVKRLLFGSVAEAVVRRTSVLETVVREY